jgi:hypothetical protein
MCEMIKQATRSVFLVVLLLLSCNLMADLILSQGGANGGEMAIGTFNSTTSASGWAFEGEGGVGEFCSAVWTASPD